MWVTEEEGACDSEHIHVSVWWLGGWPKKLLQREPQGRTVCRSTEFAKCESPCWKIPAYFSVDKLSNEFPADSSKRNQKLMDPTNAQCCKLVHMVL